MAHFRGVMQGNRGETSRLGSKHSGLTAHLSGWGIGVDISLRHENGVDVIYIRKTGGSSKRRVNLPYAFTIEEEK